MIDSHAGTSVKIGSVNKTDFRKHIIEEGADVHQRPVKGNESKTIITGFRPSMPVECFAASVTMG